MSRKGVAVPLSFDHKPIHEGELARIKAAGGMVRFGRVFGILAVSRAIGDIGFKEGPEEFPEKQMVTCVPDVEDFKRTGDEEFIIIACDGMWEVKSSEEAVEAIHHEIYNDNFKKKIPLQKLVTGLENIIDTCWARNRLADSKGQDNISAVLVEFNK